MDEDADGHVAQHSSCIRCSAYDGFPCLTNGKADAQIICVDPALRYKNVTLMTGAYVDRLETDAAGRTVTGVNVRTGNELATYRADIVVVAAGALSSSLLMFRSANTVHPAGLANGSDQVGRNYMRHNNSAFMAVSREPNETTYQKTMALNDFYFGADDWEYPLGGIQTLGKSHGAVIKAEALPQFLSWFPDIPFDMLARHALDFWLMTEDLPRPENRIELKPEGRVVLTINPTSDEALRRLRHKLEELLSKVDVHPHLLERSLYLGKNVPIGGTAHQAGTMRFGTDPASSVLDTNCKAHQLDNLYVTDASFFPSIGAVNPTLTIIANALRVADHLKERLGVSSDLTASTSTSAPAAMAAPSTATHRQARCKRITPRPSTAPAALPRLSAPMLSDDASVGASTATFMIRAWSEGTSAKVATPQAKTVATAGTGDRIVKANSTSSAVSEPSTTTSVRCSARSAKWPPSQLPIVRPTP